MPVQCSFGPLEVWSDSCRHRGPPFSLLFPTSARGRRRAGQRRVCSKGSEGGQVDAGSAERKRGGNAANRRPPCPHSRCTVSCRQVRSSRVPNYHGVGIKDAIFGTLPYMKHSRSLPSHHPVGLAAARNSYAIARLAYLIPQIARIGHRHSLRNIEICICLPQIPDSAPGIQPQYRVRRSPHAHRTVRQAMQANWNRITLPQNTKRTCISIV